MNDQFSPFYGGKVSTKIQPPAPPPPSFRPMPHPGIIVATDGFIEMLTRGVDGQAIIPGAEEAGLASGCVRYGMLVPVETGGYEITDRGRQALENGIWMKDYEAWRATL